MQTIHRLVVAMHHVFCVVVLPSLRGQFAHGSKFCRTEPHNATQLNCAGRSSPGRGSL